MPGISGKCRRPDLSLKLILFEDEHLLVVNKPAGWNTHAPGPFAGEGVYDWLKHREPRWATLAIIHRLDKETSGVLVFGKTAQGNRSLAEQFAARSVRKKYLLLTDRNLTQKNLTIASTIVRAGEKYVSRPLHDGGDRAETRFSILSTGAGRTLAEAVPVTGRTHQIRVHAASLGFPILGDRLYGGTPAVRVFLHASELALLHPVTKEQLKFRAPDAWDADARIGVRSELREAIIDSEVTDSFRIIHGASDDWPGLYVDKLGHWLIAQSEEELNTAQKTELERLACLLNSVGVYHKTLNQNVRRTGMEASSPRLVSGQAAPARFTVRENGLTFELSFNEGYSVGLFLDQRDNRRRWGVNQVASDFPLWTNRPSGAEVLNVFAYTCGFSIAAAKAGALTTSLDLSKKYLEWGQRNFALNELDPIRHDFLCGDAFDWMRRLAKKGRTFDTILLDPPTFSRSKESGVWQAERHYGKLVAAALPLLQANGILFASTNAAKLAPEEFLANIGEAVKEQRRTILRQHYVPQPPDFPISRSESAYLKTVWLRIA